MSLLRLTVLACSAALVGTLSMSPAHAVGPGALARAIGALPAVPVPYTKYDGPVCTDGDPQCIVEVIAKMEDRLPPPAPPRRPHPLSPPWPRPATTTRSSPSPTCG